MNGKKSPTGQSAELDGWTPKMLTSLETIHPAPVDALSALLDCSAPVAAVGEVLPPLWHWVALPQWPVSSALGPDGHSRRGDFLPPLDLPRRMFAGGEVVLHRYLRVGAQVVREEKVDSVEEKQGRSGRFTVVRVTTRLLDPERGGVLLEERRDLVYRPAAPARTSVPDPQPAAAMTPAERPMVAADGGWRFVTDPTLLMRFSAATANAHRIHYDWPYATRIEGYPGLVVHGPLTTLVLAEALRLTWPDRPVLHLRHRHNAPLFCGVPARIELDTEAAVVSLRDGSGAILSSLDAGLNIDQAPEAESPKGITHA